MPEHHRPGSIPRVSTYNTVQIYGATSPERSLAKYYNWCLEQTNYSHGCKWDGDMIAIPTFDAVREFTGTHDIVVFDGYDVLARKTTDYGSRIFRYDPVHTRYEDWDLYELLMHEYPKVFLFEEKCYLHMKLVKRDWLRRQWVSPNDSAVRALPEPGSGLMGRMSTSRVVARLLSFGRRMSKGAHRG